MLETCEDRTVPTAVVTIETLGSAIEGNDAVVRFTRSDTSGSLFVSYSIGGTATPSVDHNKSSTGFISFANGVATADLTITTTDDSESEPTESIIVTIEPDSGYTVGTQSIATAYIYDNDAQIISLSSADAFEGGANGLFRFHRIGDLSGSLTVNFTVGGTATTGTDYTAIGTSVNFAALASFADKVVVALPDNLVEDPEYVQATLASGTGYSIGSPNYSLVFIHDDPPVVSVEKISGAVEGGSNGTFRISRTGGDITQTLVVSYSVGGTADEGDDYTALTGTVTIAADVSYADVTVVALEDDLIEGSETVSVTVTSGTGYTPGSSNTANLTIIDVISDGTFEWDNVGTVRATVTYDAPGYTGVFFWNYHLTNDSFSAGIANFALPAVADDVTVYNLGSSLGWSGSIGTFLSDECLVAWETGGSALSTSNSAEFWFTTAPTGIGLTNGFVGDDNQLTFSPGLLFIPINTAPVPEEAEPFVVVTKSDTLDLKPLSLRDAITKINLDSFDKKNRPITKIVFAKKPLDGETISLTTMLPIIEKTTVIDGQTYNITIARGAMLGDFRLFQVGRDNVAPTAALKNLTLKDGGGSRDGSNEIIGAAILAYSGDLVLVNCTIKNNSAVYGGGIYARAGTLSITNCNIFDNWASFGGGISIREDVTSVSITGGSIHDNTAILFGGGIHIRGGEDVPIILNNVQIYLNFTTNGDGGGIYVQNNQNNGGSPQLVLTGGTLIFNNFADDGEAESSKGGGVYFGAGTLWLLDGAITENGAWEGGGVYLVDGASVEDDLIGISFFIWDNLLDNTNGGAG